MKLTSRFFLGLSACCATASMLIFLIVPTRLFMRCVHLGEASLSLFYVPGLTAAVVAAALFWLLARVLRIESSGRDVLDSLEPLPAPKKKVFLIIQCVLTAVILFRVVSQMNLPFNYDEQTHFTSLAANQYADINPLGSSSFHAIGSATAYLSMKLFGPSPIAARLPAVLLSLLFLLAINIFCWRYASMITLLLLFAHLAANQMSIWYMHSLRGYISMMIFTFIPFAIVYQVTKDRTFLKKRQIVLFGLFVALGFLAHALAAVYNLALICGLALWLLIYGKKLPPLSLLEAKRLLLVGVFLIPVSLLGSFYSLFFTHARDQILMTSDNLPNGVQEIEHLLGFETGWELKLAFLAMAAILFFARKNRRFNVDFSFFYLLSCMIFFLVPVLELKGAAIMARFLLPLVPILMFWIGTDGLSQVQWTGQRQRWTVVALILFCLFPLLDGPSVVVDQTEAVGQFDQFISRVATTLSKSAANTCVSVEGNASEAFWARALYLKQWNERAECKNHFRVVLGGEKKENSGLIFSDIGGRALYFTPPYISRK